MLLEMLIRWIIDQMDAMQKVTYADWIDAGNPAIPMRQFERAKKIAERRERHPRILRAIEVEKASIKRAVDRAR